MPSTPKPSATSHRTANDDAPSVALSEATEVLLWFGALMLRAGNTATRTREWIEVITRKMGFEDVSVSFSLDSIAASVRCGGERVTTMREIGPPGINAWRIAELEQLARTVGPGPAPRDVAARLAIIESTAPRYSSVTIAAAVGAASAGFAFLNGAATREMIAAAIGRRDRPVVAIVDVAPSAQSIWCGRIICHCGVGDIRSGGGARALRRLGVCALPGRLHRLRAVFDSRVPLNCRAVRFAAIPDRRGREPAGIRRHDSAGCRFWTQHRCRARAELTCRGNRRLNSYTL